MEEQLKKLKELEHQLTLMRDDFSGYAEFVQRNIKQSKELTALEDKLHRIEEQATRWKRATDEKEYLVRDLAIIQDICEGKA